jgi:hypothetical protein
MPSGLVTAVNAKQNLKATSGTNFVGDPQATFFKCSTPWYFVAFIRGNYTKGMKP